MLNWLLSFRLRLLFRGAFLLLAAATVLLALYLLREEKRLAYRGYRDNLGKTMEQIDATLRHPSGQLALLNPKAQATDGTPLHPLLLPFAAIDFDDQNKAQQAVEMAGCQVQYGRDGALCVAVGNNPWAGGFIYLVGRTHAGALQAHARGDARLDGAHRLVVSVAMRGQLYRWVAPFETLADGDARHGHLTGFVERERGDYARARPVRDFRGWLWQDRHCEPTSGEPATADCPHTSYFSARLPIALLSDAFAANHQLAWPPDDLDRIAVHVALLPPGDGAALFDSARPGATPPFALADLRPLLLPGEQLHIVKQGQGGGELAQLVGVADKADDSLPWVRGLLRRLRVDGDERALVQRSQIATALGSYEVQLIGDLRGIDSRLAAVATRGAWFVGAMLLALFLAWLVIEIGMVRRIAILTRRAERVSKTVKGSGGLEQFNLADLRGRDELGILASCLADLMQRVREDVRREEIRAVQERDRWHAVGHEIMSPLQSLLALHGDDESTRYILRMQQAVKVLYGQASPSEAFESTVLDLDRLDLDAFLRSVADNAAGAGFAQVAYQGPGAAVWVKADEYSLEDAVTHILSNADRFRPAGTPITLALAASPASATLRIHNQGPAIAADMLEKIFEYGVSDQPDAAAAGNRGQGLFVARTYMAKMGGSIAAENVADGVVFVLTLPRAEG